MANQLFIKEFETLPTVGGNAAQIWAEPASVEQSPVTVGASHHESAAFGTKTKFIAITADVDTSFLISTAGTAAAATNFPIWAKSYLVVAVRPGDTLSCFAWS